MRNACVTICLLATSAALGQSNLANSQGWMIQAGQAFTVSSPQGNNGLQVQVQPLAPSCQKPWARPQNPLLMIVPPKPPKPMAKMEPIPTQWPNAKWEQIPTRWPQLRAVPLEAQPGSSAAVLPQRR